MVDLDPTWTIAVAIITRTNDAGVNAAETVQELPRRH